MGWTEEEYLGQRWEFLNELFVFIIERNKKQNGKQQGTTNHIKSRR